MNVLEKILEEIEDMRDIMKSTVATDCFGKECENEDCTVCVCERAMEMVRSHMDEVENMSGKRLIDANALDDEAMNLFIAITGNPKQTTVIRECKESFRRMIDEQPTVYVNDDWIPVSERLPEKTGYYLAQLSRKLPNEDYSDRVVILFNGEEKEFMCYAELIIAWQPLPEPYKGE